MKATTEDYFDAPRIDTTRWISELLQRFQWCRCRESSLALRLDASYLRSAGGRSVSARFFGAASSLSSMDFPLAYGDILGFTGSSAAHRRPDERGSRSGCCRWAGA